MFLLPIRRSTANDRNNIQTILKIMCRSQLGFAIWKMKSCQFLFSAWVCIYSETATSAWTRILALLLFLFITNTHFDRKMHFDLSLYYYSVSTEVIYGEENPYSTRIDAKIAHKNSKAAHTFEKFTWINISFAVGTDIVLAEFGRNKIFSNRGISEPHWFDSCIWNELNCIHHACSFCDQHIEWLWGIL